MPYTIDATLNAFVVALRAGIAAVWTDVVPNGIFEGGQAVDVAWEDYAIPYAVMLVGDLERDDAWGMQNEVYHLEVRVIRVQSIYGGDAPLRTNLGQLVNYLLANDLGTGEVMDVSEIRTGRAIAANELFVTKGYTQRAGQVTLHCIVGETNG